MSDLNLQHASQRLKRWLDEGMHGTMQYMEQHAHFRENPEQLVPSAIRAITVRMDYLPINTSDDWRETSWQAIEKNSTAYISLYARGRDYHKIIRKNLQQLANSIQEKIDSTNALFNYRVFCDSAPVMEVELANKAGLGWRGKHTLLLNRDAGSMFFLGELLTNLPLPPTLPVTEHCGTCQACITVCPTQAIVKPYVLDARKCISYLTIEHSGAIPEQYRSPIGNRIYGCDDCQLICPWNKFAKKNSAPDFKARGVFTQPDLVFLFELNQDQFLDIMAGSAIRRIGHERWQRNIAVAMGNASKSESIMKCLRNAQNHPSELVREHVVWALKKQSENASDCSQGFF